jgi:hypothetical protein
MSFYSFFDSAKSAIRKLNFLRSRLLVVHYELREPESYFQAIDALENLNKVVHDVLQRISTKVNYLFVFFFFFFLSFCACNRCFFNNKIIGW